MKRIQLYVVEWKDIQSDARWHEGEISKAEPARCITCGWLIFENEEKIILADSKAVDGEFGGLTIIPKGCVVARKRVSAKAPEGFLQ